MNKSNNNNNNNDNGIILGKSIHGVIPFAHIKLFIRYILCTEESFFL